MTRRAILALLLGGCVSSNPNSRSPLPMATQVRTSEARQPMLHMAALLDAPADRIADVILAVEPGPVTPNNGLVLSASGEANQELTPTDTPDLWSVTVGSPPAPGMRLQVDREARAIIVSGEWWYRLVVSVEPDGDRSLLHYRVYNEATGLARLVPFYAAGIGSKAQREVHLLVDSITERLGCGAEFVAEPSAG